MCFDGPKICKMDLEAWSLGVEALMWQKYWVRLKVHAHGCINLSQDFSLAWDKRPTQFFLKIHQGHLLVIL